MTETPERPEHERIAGYLAETAAALRDVVDFAYEHGYHEHGVPLVDELLRLAARAGSLGEPVSQEAPEDDLWDRYDSGTYGELPPRIREFLKSRGEGGHYWDNLTRDEDQRRWLIKRLEEMLASRSAFSGIPRTENEPCTCALAGLDATAHDGHLADCPKCAHPPGEEDNAMECWAVCFEASGVVVKAGSDELMIYGSRSEAVRNQPEGCHVEKVTVSRLSASAPSPEDKGSRC